MEITCQACSGEGVQSTPMPAIDEHGNPVIEHVYSACIACTGNGKVTV